MEFIVHEEKDRLDKYISNKTDEISRVMIQKLIDEGEILVNGKSQKASYKVQNGDKISINIPEVKEVGLKSQDIPLDIIYEDNDILEKFAQVIVPDDQLSLAIGKAGQNARLAARLTGWKIDIKSETQFREMLSKQQEESDEETKTEE